MVCADYFPISPRELSNLYEPVEGPKSTAEAGILDPTRLETLAAIYDKCIQFAHRETAGNFDSIDSTFRAKVSEEPSQLNRIRFETLLEYAAEETKQNIAAGKLKTSSILYHHLRPLKREEEDKIFSIFLLETITRLYDYCMQSLSMNLQQYTHSSLNDLEVSKYEEISSLIGCFAGNTFIAEWNCFQSKPNFPPLLIIEISPSDWKNLADKRFYKFRIYPNYLQPVSGASNRCKLLNKLNERAQNTSYELLDEEFAKKCAVQLDNLRLYVFVSKQLGKNIDDLSEQDIQSFRKAFEQNKINEALNTFKVQESPKKSHVKRKKTKKRKLKKTAGKAPKQTDATQNPPKKPAAPVLSEMQNKVIQLNESLKEFPSNVHDRILRWQDYEGDAFQRDRHNLASMIHLIEDRELCEQLSLPYTWRNGVQQGKAFFVEMIKGAEKKFGCINVAIGREDNVMFHAMFRELREVSLPHLQEILQADFDEELLGTEGPWKQISDCSFDLTKDEKNIELHVGKEDPVIFRFHSPSV